jgi:trehalose 6-phosphate synthase/phosphatase
MTFPQDLKVTVGARPDGIVEFPRMPRYLIVSNRLPVTVVPSGDGFELKPSAGGLATAMAGLGKDGEQLWIGWPGDTTALAPEAVEQLDQELTTRGLLPVHLTAADVQGFYEGFSNGVLWPLFHYQIERVNMDAWRDWEAYESVNRQFARVIAEHWREGDRIWVHDYQLMLVPAMVRELLPEAIIGFFLHIPFPSLEVFRTLPWRQEVITGLLGADVIGFHTYGYQRHFASCLLRMMGLDVHVDEVHWQERLIRLGSFPISIDTEDFMRRASDGSAAEAAAKTVLPASGVKLLLGVDRLDYSKGLPRRFLAIERLLEIDPSLQGRFRFVQVSVPSRTNVETYAQYRRQIDELVGRINGRFSTTDWAPIQYLYRSISTEELVALYRTAEVMVVTPLRDGMNLVAKEYVACRTEEDGVLVLSEFAGAAWELGQAVMVNPYNVHQTALALRQAILMDKEEQTTRMKPMRARVRDWDVRAWARSFVATMDAAAERPVDESLESNLPTVDELTSMHSARKLHLILDYDGTLVPFAGAPELAAPDPELLELLAALAAHPRLTVHLGSGRSRSELEEWFGHLAIGLHAENGFWSRSVGTPWRANAVISQGWKERIRPVLETFAAHTPGAFVEEKDTALCWHYRLADPELGETQSRELQLHLTSFLANFPVQVMPGSCVVEVRQHGVNKGIVLPSILATIIMSPEEFVVAFGANRTDEDLFAALPEYGVGIKVGPGVTLASRRLRDPGATREFLKDLLQNCGSAPSGALATAKALWQRLVGRKSVPPTKAA